MSIDQEAKEPSVVEPDPAPPGISATYRVTAIMHALTEPGEGMSVRAIAAATATSRSATHRILQTLVEEGYAVQSTGGRYQSGPEMLRLAARTFTGSAVIRLADSIMSRLVDEVDETAYLGTFLPQEMAVSFIHRVEPTHPLRYIQQLGVPLPLDRGAIGKAILAQAVLETAWAEQTDPSLSPMLEEIRARGFAVTHEERVQGVTGIAASIGAGGVVIGGLTLAVPTARFDASNVEVLGGRVVHYAHEITQGLATLESSAF